MNSPLTSLVLVAVLLLSACGGAARLPLAAGVGPNPALPEPESSLIPTVEYARGVGWPAAAKPVAAEGLEVEAFARDLDHPRWLHVLPNGDVLVAETNAPPRPDEGKGIKGKVMQWVKGRTGSATPSANRITLLRDADGDGVAETRSAFLEGVNSPFGMALVGDDFYVAATDAVLRVPYERGATKITAKPKKLADLPGGDLNHHWTKSLIADPSGKSLFVGVGSNSNVAEQGMDLEHERAAVLEVSTKDGSHRVFASGLRNPVGLAWEPKTGKLWTAVNERDELGSDLVPDYITTVEDGAFYGWPYSYFGAHVDERVQPPRPDLVARAVVPDYALGAHTASLGLASSKGTSLPNRFADGMFVGQHGSWNRKPPSGYAVIFVPFRDGKPSGLPLEVLTGFLAEDGDEAYGRPVGVALDGGGALLVADDVGNTVWRVTPSGRRAKPEPATEPSRKRAAD